VPWPELPSRQARPSHPGAARIWEGQGPRRERAERAQAGDEGRRRTLRASLVPPSTRARPEQAGGGQLAPDSAGRLDTVQIPGGMLDYEYYPPGTPSGAGKTSDILGPYGTKTGYYVWCP
jgi:hypothetical protein